MSWPKGIVIAIAILFQLANGQVPAGSSKLVPEGVWGGDHLVLTVRADGADFEFDCAIGHIRSPLTVDANGEFRVKGTYQVQTPAPMRADNPGNDEGNEVVYAGKLRGNELEITVTLPGDRRPSVFHLKRDREPNLTKCM